MTARTHGHAARNRLSPEYTAWRNAKARCFYVGATQYRDYGGRGISMYAAWRDSFEEFLLHMGPRPSVKHSLDRLDNNGHYEPGNVRWATKKQQARNRRRAVRRCPHCNRLL